MVDRWINESGVSKMTAARMTFNERILPCKSNRISIMMNSFRCFLHMDQLQVGKSFGTNIMSKVVESIAKHDFLPVGSMVSQD